MNDKEYQQGMVLLELMKDKFTNTLSDPVFEIRKIEIMTVDSSQKFFYFFRHTIIVKAATGSAFRKRYVTVIKALIFMNWKY